MKKLFLILFGLASFASIGAGNARAISYSMDYWTLSDNSTKFTIEIEDASYESEFGLFAYEDPDNRFQVLSKNNETNDYQRVYFQYDSGWQVSLNDTDWIDFVDTFGFYYGVYTGGMNDSDMDYLWFTDRQYNQYYGGSYADGTCTLVDTDIEHIRTFYDGIDSLRIELDDQLNGGDRDWSDMTIVADDLQPVPEPATMLLLGAGLIGMAGLTRKKMFDN